MGTKETMEFPEELYVQIEQDWFNAQENTSKFDPLDGPVAVYKLVKIGNLKRTVTDELV